MTSFFFRAGDVGKLMCTLCDFGLMLQCKWDLRSYWDFVQRRMVVSYQHFGKTYQSHLQGSSSSVIGSLRTSDRVHHPLYKLRTQMFPASFLDCLTQGSRWDRYIVPKCRLKNYHSELLNIPNEGWLMCTLLQCTDFFTNVNVTYRLLECIASCVSTIQ